MTFPDRFVSCFTCSAEPTVRKYYLRRWLKDPTFDSDDFRVLIDWEYYKDRLGKTIQKIVSIPAAMQGIKNPCARVELPDWMLRRVREKSSGMKQASITDMFLRGNRMMITAPRPSDLSKSDTSISNLMESGSKMKKRLLQAADGGVGSEGEGQTQIEVEIDIEDMVHPLVSTGAVTTPAKLSPSSETATDSSRSAHPLVRASRSPSKNVEEETTEVRNPDDEETQLDPIEENIVVEADSVDPGSSLPLTGPVSSDALQTWLEARKAEWEQERIRRHLGAASGNYTSAPEAGAKKRPMGVTDLLKKAADDISHGLWQVKGVQYSPVTSGIVF